MSEPNLDSLLKTHFGYDTFRPPQREIIQASLAGKDVVAILPTGAGKSLCFQLPALARQGLTLVISPLIALMKDQVDALESIGVPATFLNSSLDSMEIQRRREGLFQGTFKLLYAAPERVMTPGFLEDLRRWNVEVVAIDEAHCISEWGHDFRPEYRQLRELRQAVPEVSFMALTATATTRVREDISSQLGLRDPDLFLASFNRPNLNYHILPKQKVVQQVFGLVHERREEAGIVYVQSRKTAENMAATLAAEGIQARPYHAGLDPAVRSANQEAFLRDEARVICATIAFGMGINKPDVRFVIHADLPKNIESYYQETGRAGRDGLPSDCLLLYSRGDLVRNLKFLDEHQDPATAEIARRQMGQMADFAESEECRRFGLLDYFGERWTEDNCGGCDICLQPRETWEATVPAQKFLSCVVRISQNSGFEVGLNHVVAVLCGANTEKIRRWNHDQLSTYGIGGELSRTEWTLLGRQLLRKGLIAATEDQFQTLRLTNAGRSILKNREPVELTRPPSLPAKPDAAEANRPRRAGSVVCDEALFEQLRKLRKEMADQRGVPPYVVFGDLTLRHMARAYPGNPIEFLALPGVGQKKLEDYGETFLGLIREWLTTHEPLEFESDSPAPPPPPMKSQTGLKPSARESMERFLVGRSIREIATERNLSRGTIASHLADAIVSGDLPPDARPFYSEAEEERIRAVAAIHGSTRLAPLHEALGGEVPYEKLHIFRAIEQRKPARAGE